MCRWDMENRGVTTSPSLNMGVYVELTMYYVKLEIVE